MNTKNAKAGGKKGDRRRQNKKPASAGDLDMDMDKCNSEIIRCYSVYGYVDWFEAGKGPDPVKAALDREMDSYHQAKNAAPATTPAVPVV